MAVKYRYVSLDLELANAFGSPVITNPWYASPMDGSMDLDNAILLKAGMASQAPTAQKLGKLGLAGSISSVLDAQFAGHIVDGVLGKASLGTGFGGNADVFEHVIEGDGETPSYTMHLCRDGGGAADYRLAQYSGTLFTSFAIEAVVNDFITVSGDWIARNETLLDNSEATPFPLDDQPELFVFHEADMSFYEGSSWGAVDVSAFRISVANGYDAEHLYLGDRKLGGPNSVRPPVAARTCTGSIDIPLHAAASMDQFRRAYDGLTTGTTPGTEFTPVRARLVVVGNKKCGVSLDENYAFWSYFPQLVINNREAGISARDPTMMTIPFTALLGDVEAEAPTYIDFESDPLFSAAGLTLPDDADLLMGFVNEHSSAYGLTAAPP